jgi:hypothetical protein
MADSGITKSLIARLHSSDCRSRDVAAAESGDYFEAEQLNAAGYQSLVNALIPAALAEQDPVVRESMFNALSSAAAYPKATLIDWHPIADRLPDLPQDCLEHALVILGFSGDGSYLPRIEPLLDHPDKDIRRYVADAVNMLRGKASKARLKTGTR